MKKGLILIFCLLLGLSWYTTISDIVNKPKEFQKHLDSAASYMEKEIYVDAIKEYESALEYEPNHMDTSLMLADAYLKIHEDYKFEDICTNLAEVYQDSEIPLDTLMNYYMEDERELSALKYVKDFLKKYPENTGANKWMKKLEGSYEFLYCYYDSMEEIVFDNFVVSQGGMYGVVDETGENILDPIYEEANPFSENELALVKFEGKYRYVDKDGLTRLVPDQSYEMVGMLSSNRTVALKSNKYAYVNEKLETVTDFAWEELTLVEGGIGAGKQKGKWALLNENGEAQTEYIYDDVARDENGFCSFNKRIFVKNKKKYQMINTKAETIGTLKFDDAKPFYAGNLAAVCMKGKWGFVNMDGELVVECKYDDAKSSNNGYAAVGVDGKWGYIDESGYMIIEPTFESAGTISSSGTAVVFVDEEWRLIQLNIFK